MNLDEYSDDETHWIAFYAFNNNVTYFESFGVEHISQQMKTLTGNKNKKGSTITEVIFRIQA